MRNKTDWAFWFCVAIWAALATTVIVGYASSASGSEIVVEERIVDLPQDADKWFVSVVGAPGNKQYSQLIQWFDNNEKLYKLRAQVHFWNVPFGSKAFERYRDNVTDLPLIRVQQSDGYVVFEARGEEIPSTSDQLYVDIAVSAEQAMAGDVVTEWPILRRPLLPYRRHNDRLRDENNDTCPTPGPLPEPPYLAPVPPDLGLVGPPDLEEPKRAGMPGIVTVGLILASLLGGGGLGLANQWKKTYKVE
jgi:hypothetical protein